MERDRAERLIEFLVIGVVAGISEDLLAVWLATGETITPHVVGIVVLVAIPFAVVSELVVDSEDFPLFRRIAERLHRETR